ncbi:MAG: hypothetical protein ACK4V6_02405, partial [Microthrixaceae bacterium]
MGHPGVLTLNDATPVPLPRNREVDPDDDLRLSLELLMNYGVIEWDGDMPYKVSTTAYYVTLRDPVGELYAFHWHPGTDSVEFPHLHVRGH